MDKVVSVPYTTQTTKVKFDYKIPAKYQKMVYTSNSLQNPGTNTIVLYAMTGVRDDALNQLTVQATYRCTFEK